MLADDLPGVSARAVLRQSEDVEGATTIVLEVTEDRPFSLSATVDNRGSESVGPIQIDVTGRLFNMFQPNSETTFRFINASANTELLYGSVEHAFVLNGEGTTISFGIRHSAAEPGTPTLEAIELETEATTGFVEVRHPVIRSRNLNLEAFGEFEIRNSETLAFDTRTSLDRIRSLRFGADFDNTDSAGGLNEAGIQLSFGLPILQASSNDDPLNSREAGLVDYSSVVANVARTQQLGVLHSDLSAWSVRGSAEAQYAADPLLSSEECGIGGSSFGRAFDSSTLSGDQCAALSLEVRYNLPEIGPLDGLQLYGFYDHGWVNNLDPGGESDFLESAGIGARFSLLEHVSGSVEIAQQIRNTGIGGRSHDEPRVFFSLTGAL